MKRLNILCILVLISVCSAEDVMFFAEDHYKVLGAPLIEASSVNPVLSPDDNVLVLQMGNIGKVSELIPTQRNGSDEEIMKEIREEMRSVDAMNVTATLHGSGIVDVFSEPFAAASLPAGSVSRMKFNISAGEANGWYYLPLILDYEHQADVMISNGSVMPLYQLESKNVLIKVFIEGHNGLGVEGVKSDLHPGREGTILTAIANHGYETLGNCTAKIITSPYFISESYAHLGDIAPGQIAVAELAVAVDGNVSGSNYNLACELSYDGGSSILQVPLHLEKASNIMTYALIALLLVMAVLTAGIFWRKSQRKTKWRKFSR